jgi:hypothetical protein
MGPRLLLALQKLQLVRLAGPVLCVSGRLFPLGDIWPDLGELSIQLEESFLVAGKLVLRVDRVHRALGFTERTIDAFIRMNDQKIRSLIETINRANLNTVGVFAFDAIFANNERHTDTSFIPRRRILAKK